MVTPKGADWGTVWSWAEHQINAPFNAFDLNGSGDLVRNKLCNQAGVPAAVSVLFGAHTDEIPALRLVSFKDLFDALKALAPFATTNQRCDALDIDTAGLSINEQLQLTSVVHLTAQRACGRLLHELDYRDKNWKASTPEAYAAEARQDAEPVLTALMEKTAEVAQ